MYRGNKRSVLQALIFAVSTLRLLTQRFDVIEADHMPYLQLFPLRLVTWIRRVPLVVTWHEVWGDEGWHTYLGRSGGAAATLERICVRLPDAIVAVSSGTASKLTAMGAKVDRLHVVPNTLDFDALIATEPCPSAPELLFIGRLLEHKNADLAIDAVAQLVSRGLDIHLGIVGVGPEAARLRSQVQDLKLGDRVRFFSSLDTQEELWSLIRGSQVLLAPSVREGFGLVVAESLTLGTPVVCALHAENESSHLISPLTGSVVAPFDASALADAAEYWLHDTSDRGLRASVFMSEHPELSLDAMTKSYAAILREVTT
jgi:glycosyltransferase involved in cell wall biosynthesis